MLETLQYVVEAINNLDQFNILYPFCHLKHMTVAKGFQKASTVGFNACAGAIDGLFIWINKPSLAELRCVGIDQQELFCGKKNKCGLSCQAVCAVSNCFLEMSITYCGALFDLLTFEDSKFYKHVED